MKNDWLRARQGLARELCLLRTIDRAARAEGDLADRIRLKRLAALSRARIARGYARLQATRSR